MRSPLALLACAACSQPAYEEPPHPDAASCDPDDVRLRVVRDGETPARIYALVTVDGNPAALLVDTGSQATFLSTTGPRDPVANAGVIDFGCSTRTVIGRPVGSAEQIDGRPVVGFLGASFFLEKPRVIDLVAETIRAGTCPPGVTIPYENRANYLFVRPRVNDESLVLGFDTGAAHTLWLKQPPEPGDTEVVTTDAYGNPLTLWLGSATLEVAPRPPRRVPILRAPTFPSLEDTNRALGGGIAGLFGLSALDATQICIDAAASTITLAQ